VQPDLLRPSLGGEAALRPLYSPRANFIVAFFGGPLALILFSGLNARRLRRLPKDLPFYVGAFAIVALALYALAATSLGTSIAVALGSEGSARQVTRIGSRVLALLLWGFFHLRHRRFQRSAELWDAPRPNPWPAGLACTALGTALTVGLLALILPRPVA
jgi:hypothetical protein